MSTRLLALGLLVAGCAPAAPLVVGPSHPSSPAAAAAPLVVEGGALPRAERPALPAPLRTDAATPPAGHAPSASAHGAGPLTDVLDAYLDLQAGLAADQFERERATALEAAFAAWERVTPDGDPHFWHARPDGARAARAALEALAEAPDLDAARQPFGRFSAPFVRLVEAAGTPDGYGLERHTCGMARGVPDGGVWLQRPGPVANPYFGSAMRTCTRGGAPLSADPGATPHDGHE